MNGRIYYRKLIRDNIPDKIAKEGSECETRVLSEEEFKKKLRRKVVEEASAIPVVETRDELIDELADLHAVIEALKEREGVTDTDMDKAIEQNMLKKGGFTKRLFLEWSSDSGYKSNEKIQ